jgi:hypothetical protein
VIEKSDSHMQKRAVDFLKNGDPKGKTGPVWELAAVGGRRI